MFFAIKKLTGNKFINIKWTSIHHDKNKEKPTCFTKMNRSTVTDTPFSDCKNIKSFCYFSFHSKYQIAIEELI